MLGKARGPDKEVYRATCALEALGGTSPDRGARLSRHAHEAWRRWGRGFQTILRGVGGTPYIVIDCSDLGVNRAKGRTHSAGVICASYHTSPNAEEPVERLVITIHPAPTEEGLLRVPEAMQHVLDLLKLHEEATRAVAPDASFQWRLESASANSPFQIVALAEADDPTIGDIDAVVREASAEFSSGLHRLAEAGQPAWWMGREAINTARSLFMRSQNGIALTEIDAGPTVRFAIDRPFADAGVKAVGGIDVLRIDAEVGERVAWGEIQGIMVAVGRYRSRPAVQMRTHQYDVVWCLLPEHIVSQFGSTHSIAEVWEGRTIAADGQLVYAANGKLRIIADDVRVVADAPRVSLDSVLDPDFTAGLEASEYLRRLREGDLV